MKCIIVEDVITSGGSAIQAANAAREFGMDVIAVLAVIDRLEGGQAAFAAANLKLQTLLTINDFEIPPRRRIVEFIVTGQIAISQSTLAPGYCSEPDANVR